MPSDPVQALLSVLLVDAAILGLAIGLFWAGVFVARRLGHPVDYGLGSLGLSKPRSGYLAATRLGFAVGVGALMVSFVILPLSILVVEELGYSTERTVQEPLMRGIQWWVGESPEVAIPATVFVVVLFAPAVEEIIFRGAIFGGLRKLVALPFRRLHGHAKVGGTVSFAFAALVSSVLFALLHLEPVLVPTLFLLGIALCMLYRRTGSLLPCFAAHATFNSFAVLVIILSGLEALPVQV